MTQPMKTTAPLRPMMQNDRVAQALGMTVLVDEPGHVAVTMTVREDMLNGFSITHGGMVFALADTAFAIACNDIASHDTDAMTVAGGADISFLKPTREGQTLTADAVRRTGLYDVTVTDDSGEAVAEFRGRSVTTRPRAEV